MIMRAFLAKELAESVRRPDCDAHEEIERTLNKFISVVVSCLFICTTDIFRKICALKEVVSMPMQESS
jgi:hypothetical protein